ncbi:phosphotransferase [Hwanghaeella sp.]|uniref:phosphotransferase n=1 Tax=Hwanghaeella sp. TaxID=2605943 RepID=UPI003CCC1D54
MTAIDQAITRACSLPCWTDPQDAEPLGGGITNINITLSDQGKKYVVRLGQDIPEHSVLRFNELAISRAAEAAGISPRIHYSEPGALVLEYVESRAMVEEDLHDHQTLISVAKLIRDVHTNVTDIVRGPIVTFWVFHVVRDYAAFLKENGSVHIPKLQALLDEASALERSVGKIDLVLGHNDLLPANILQAEDRLWLVDWEYGGFNSPLFDLGGVATNCSLPEEAEHLLLKTYFGADPDPALLRSYNAMKCGSLLRETMWSMVSEITSEIDFDYGAYTAENLSRYERAITNIFPQRGLK